MLLVFLELHLHLDIVLFVFKVPRGHGPVILLHIFFFSGFVGSVNLGGTPSRIAFEALLSPALD